MRLPASTDGLTRAQVVPAPSRHELAARARITRVAAGLLLLGAVFWGSVEWWSGVFYLKGLHGSLGRSFWPALALLWAIPLSIAVPPAIWLAWPALSRRWLPRHYAAAAVACSLAIASAALSAGLARADRVQTPVPADIESALAPLRSIARRLPRAAVAPSLLTPEPAACAAPISPGRVTVIATFLRRGERPGPVSVCRQGDRLDEVVAGLTRVLTKSALRGYVKLDIVTGTQELSSRHGWLDALKLRPGLDGVCRDRACLMPWQLLAYGFFSTHRPLEFIPDFQFGVEAERLQLALGAAGVPSLSGLLRVTTESYSIDFTAPKVRLTPLARMRRRDVAVTGESLQAATAAAETYVLEAQQSDGRFRYTLDPMTGAADVEGFNLARQGGTTLVLCELGESSERVNQGIARSVSAMLSFERRRGGLHALTHDPLASQARLGESALPWVSLLACRARIGPAFDAHIAGLASFVLALQRESGGFAPALDLRTGEALPGREPLYAGGQAVLGLLLLERLLQAHPNPALPPYELVHDAAERAMTYFATEYWSHPLRDFFYLEENWHCLAAREALGVHRHHGYERFCQDYVRFKARLILETERGVDPDFDGGFGFGNIVPPHNTGAAGFGEALSAAISVTRAQGGASAEDEALLRRVLGFLLRQQWTRDNCFACATPLVIGGLSEHTHSALTRIDFAQHAWAALGHGGRVLGLVRPGAPGG